jgi:hypothetical protein
MVDFLRERYADSLGLARRMENLAATGQLPGLNVAPSQAVDFGGVHAAESRARFLDETVIPYLGTAGPTGRIADIQLRLLADEHRGKHGYDEEWRP